MKLEVRNVSYTYAHTHARKPSAKANTKADIKTNIKADAKTDIKANTKTDIKANTKADALVLNDVSFSISSGEMVAFLGKNGAGKTTLLRIIPSFLTPLGGDVLIDGVSVRSMSLQDKAKAIAYIPQFSQTAFAYTVRESVLMGKSPHISLFNKPSKNDERRALEILEELGILALADRPTNKISGGERQLVLIARALMQDAKLLILDEPTSFLDYSNQLLVLEKTYELVKKGYACLYSTHNPDLALAYSTRVLAMDKGKIAFSKKLEELEGSDALSSIYKRPLIVERTQAGRLICVPQ